MTRRQRRQAWVAGQSRIDKRSCIHDWQHGRCAVCAGIPERGLSLHHVVFRSDGGSDRTKNLVGVCDGCHERIHRESDGDAEMKAAWRSALLRFIEDRRQMVKAVAGCEVEADR